MMETPHNPNAKPGERGYLSQGYEKSRPYGRREGLADRLADHAEKLAKDKSTPWLGLGLYDDLAAAAAILAGREPPHPKCEPDTKPKMEFDL